MQAILGLIKIIMVRMATKYAADLIVTHTIKALEKAAASTSTTIDTSLWKNSKLKKILL